MQTYVAVAEDVALSGSLDETMVQIAAASDSTFSILEVGVSFGGSAVEEPCEVTLLYQTDAGTGGNAATEAPEHPDYGTAKATALIGVWATTEPADGNVLRAWKVSPNGGLLVMPFDPGTIRADVSGRIGLSVEEKAGSTPVCTAYIRWGEG